MMNFATYLNFDGTCAEAFRFYEETFGGTLVTTMTFGETSAKTHVPSEWHDKIMHARVDVAGQMLLGSDVPPEHFTKPQGMAVSVSVSGTEEARRIFDALADRGVVTMGFQKTFWSPGFGMATDRFGTPWIVNTNQ